MWAKDVSENPVNLSTLFSLFAAEDSSNPGEWLVVGTMPDGAGNGAPAANFSTGAMSQVQAETLRDTLAALEGLYVP